ncbi:alpha/beta fold hydrolase [Roseibium suaedae]|uniref:Pimeloyl-ACP methyl ester carboxylesterase n=1 Tax=Roseibium suaedae TaxID=735517 RepID=A0A1M7IVY2_9HYPH|nr:alpha/beta hydrolase [Roseibium suaedae]SHM44869.1 Pimeloyl-ACP methyl ester carboxylesterase [Roseibium suaedae]
MIYLVGVLVVILSLLTAYTEFRVRSIEAELPADGQFVMADGVPIHLHRLQPDVELAEKPSLVFIHGASGNAYDQLGAFRAELEGRYDLIFVDRPGLGHSGRTSDAQSAPSEQARLIGEVLDALGIGKAVVVGHSLGASVTAALALERPDLVEGLVFLAPATHPWPGGVNWYYNVATLPVIGRIFCASLTLPIAERVAPKAILGVFAPEEAPADYDGMIRLPLLFRPDSFRANAQDVAGLKEHVTRLSQRYGEIDVPAVVITGDKDTVVWPSIHSQGLVRDLPQARLVTLPGAGHMPHHTRTQDVVREIDGLMELVLARKTALSRSMAAAEDTETLAGK